jgi:hypothetical protein
MKHPDTASRINSLTTQLINARLSAPPSQDEQDWVEALRQPGDTEAEDREARRLYWEWRLGLDSEWPTPVEADFDSPAEYQNYLQAVAD